MIFFYDIVTLIKIKQRGIHEDKLRMFLFSTVVVTTTTTDTFGSRSPVNTVAHWTETPACLLYEAKMGRFENIEWEYQKYKSRNRSCFYFLGYIFYV